MTVHLPHCLQTAIVHPTHFWITQKQDEDGGGKLKLIIPEANCGVPTTEDKRMDSTLAGPVGVEPRWIPSKNRMEAPLEHSQMWENFLGGMEVFVEVEDKPLLGPNI